MRHSLSLSPQVADSAESRLGERLVASVKLYVDELFDRTIVALDALLEPIGVDVARAKFAPGFMAELAAVVQVAAWEHAGLRHLIPLDFPPAAEAMSELVWRYHIEPMSFMDSAAGMAVFNGVIKAWAIHCHPDARELLGCDIVISASPHPATQAALCAPVIMAIAERTITTEHANEAS